MPTRSFMHLSDDKKQKIIDCAFKEFSENSYDKVSIFQIAKEAEISRASLYCYFENKEDIYCFLLRQIAEPFCNQIEKQAKFDIFELSTKLFLYFSDFKYTNKKDFIIKIFENLNPINQKFFFDNIIPEKENLPIVTDDFKYIDEAHLHIILYLLLSNTAISIIKYFTSDMEKNLALENFNKLIEILKFGILKGEQKWLR